MLPSGRWEDLPTLLAGADDRNAAPSALWCSGGPATLWRPPTEHGFWRILRPRCGAAAPKRPEALNARLGLMPRPGASARERDGDMRMCGELPGAYAEPPTAVSPPPAPGDVAPDAGQSAGRRITHPAWCPLGGYTVSCR